MVKKIVKPVIPIKEFETEDEYQVFLETEREWLYNIIVNSIAYSIELNLDEADIFEARINELSSAIFMSSSRKEWKRSLSLALNWFSGDEQYERCVEIQNLLSKL